MALESPHYALADGEGEAYWFANTRFTIKASAKQTGHAFTLVEQTLPPGFGPPPHIHHMEDEAFYVLDGLMTGTCGDATWEAGPGGFVWLPRGIPHTFSVASAAPARLLQVTTPSGFERFVAEAGTPALAPGLPPEEPPDIEKLVAAGYRIGIEHLLPPP